MTRPGRPAKPNNGDPPGMLLYECRSCGQIFPGRHVPDLRLALLRLADDTPLPESWGPARPSMLEPHECRQSVSGEPATYGEVIGIGELIGGRLDLKDLKG